jgi:uncharacterized alpha-E superfamily protein
MLSRVAYNLYWGARYLERAENIARFVGVTLDLSLEAHASEADTWSPLIHATGDQDTFSDQYDTITRENVLRFLCFDRDNPNSILGSLWLARENVRSVRNVISNDMWLQINALFLDMKDQAKIQAQAGQADEEFMVNFVNAVKSGCIAVMGMTDATMSRNEAWHWWHIGAMLERADKTSRILDVKYFMLLPSADHVGGNIDHLQWLALLDSASAVQMFRQEMGGLEPQAIVEFLLLNQRFPRSVAHAIVRANTSLHAITGTEAGQFKSDAERALGRLSAELCFAEIATIISDGLHEYLDGRQQAINCIDGMLAKEFFGIVDQEST